MRGKTRTAPLTGCLILCLGLSHISYGRTPAASATAGSSGPFKRALRRAEPDQNKSRSKTEVDCCGLVAVILREQSFLRSKYCEGRIILKQFLKSADL